MTVYFPFPRTSGFVTRRNRRQQGFTLIELLTVIAIIGILAGILIPVVGTVKRSANIAASKVQLSGYVNAIGLFKGEYNYYPFADAHKDGGETIPIIGVAEFVGTLSATKPDGSRITSADTEKYGNRKLISFYDFSASDFINPNSSNPEIADRFSNTNIFIAIDGDGDGQIKAVPNPNGTGTLDIHTKVTAFTLNDPNTAQTPDYYLYD